MQRFSVRTDKIRADKLWILLLSGRERTMKTKTIRQIVLINASPHDLYQAILDPKLHSKFTNSKASGSMKVGGKFTAYGGYISGTNISLEKDKKIVQKWTSADFPKGHYTQVTFEFKAEGKTAGKVTNLTFTQYNVPEENYEEIKQGWIDFYWKPLKEMFP
jgi:activator of HSP90 ATPase